MVISKLFVWILSAKKFVYISAKTIFWQMSVFIISIFCKKNLGWFYWKTPGYGLGIDKVAGPGTPQIAPKFLNFQNSLTFDPSLDLKINKKSHKIKKIWHQKIISVTPKYHKPKKNPFDVHYKTVTNFYLFFIKHELLLFFALNFCQWHFYEISTLFYFIFCKYFGR